MRPKPSDKVITATIAREIITNRIINAVWSSCALVSNALHKRTPDNYWVWYFTYNDYEGDES